MTKEPTCSLDYFSQKSIAENIVHVSGATLGNYIKSGKIFPPRYISPSSKENSSRRYYSLADAMRISLIMFGVVRMKDIHDLLDNHIKMNSAHQMYDATVRPMIQQSFEIIKEQIRTKEENPIDLQKYLVRETETQE